MRGRHDRCCGGGARGSHLVRGPVSRSRRSHTGDGRPAEVTLGGEREGPAGRIESDLLLSQPRNSSLSDGHFREERPDRSVACVAEGARKATQRAEDGMEGEETEMIQASRKIPAKGSELGEKLLRSAQQARDWVNGKAAGAGVTCVTGPHGDGRNLRARMGFSQTRFAAGFRCWVSCIQTWE